MQKKKRYGILLGRNCFRAILILFSISMIMADAASPSVAFEGGLNLSVPPSLAPEHLAEHPKLMSDAAKGLQGILKTMTPEYDIFSIAHPVEMTTSAPVRVGARTPEQERGDILKDMNQVLTDVLATPDMLGYDILQTYM